MTSEIQTFVKQIGGFLKKVRKEKKLSVRQLAVLGNVSEETISNLEMNGQTKLNLEELAALAIRIARL